MVALCCRFDSGCWLTLAPLLAAEVSNTYAAWYVMCACHTRSMSNVGTAISGWFFTKRRNLQYLEG